VLGVRHAAQADPIIAPDAIAILSLRLELRVRQRQPRTGYSEL